MQSQSAVNKIVNYCVAVASIVVAAILRMLLDPILGHEYPHVTFILAIIFTAWYGEVGPSVVAVVLGFLATAFFFAYPRGSLAIEGLDAQVGTALYVVVALSSVFFSESMHSANRRASSNANELLKKQADVEHEVNERRDAQIAHVTLLRRMVSIQEEERRKISRELHDQCGQDVAALHLGLKCLEDSTALDDEALKQVKNLHHLLDQVSQAMHHLAQELRPPALDELGLQTAVDGYLKTWSSRSGIPVDFECHGMDRRRIAPDIETALYRILQEALTNVAKHAAATGVSVILKRSEQGVQIIVDDQGIGFDVESNSLWTGSRQNLGLLGMRERIEAVGGRLDIESTPGHGTAIYARVPLTKEVE